MHLTNTLTYLLTYYTNLHQYQRSVCKNGGIPSLVLFPRHPFSCALSTLTQIASLLASTQSTFRLQAKAFALSLRRTRISSEVDMRLRCSWLSISVSGKGKQIISVSASKVISITVSVSFLRDHFYMYIVSVLKIFPLLVSV